VSIPFGEQLIKPSAASGAVATKNIRCAAIQSDSSEVSPSYDFPIELLTLEGIHRH
jgi:hypothetical protein